MSLGRSKRDVNFSLIQQKAKSLAPELTEWRNSLRMCPETGLTLPQTNQVLQNILGLMNLNTVEIGYATGSGIVAKLHGNNSEKRLTVALRAEMDALPLVEEAETPSDSRQNAAVHACGHDGHMAMALGVAKILSDMKEYWGGELRLIFQPGEEGPGGAKQMVDQGVLADVDALLGLHLDPQLPLGSIYFKDGQINSYVDFFSVILEGRGGHGAYPNQSIDPIVAAAGYIMSLQQLVSRNTSPNEAAVVTIGKINSGVASNVIPAKAALSGSLRCFHSATRKYLHQRLREIGEGIGKQYGVSHVLEIKEGYPPVYNNPNLTNICKRNLHDQLGDEVVKELEHPLTGSDDFSYMSKEVPSLLLRLGCKFPDGQESYPLHHNSFDYPENVLVTGCAFLAYTILLLLRKSS